MLDIVELGVVCDSVSEICADRIVNSGSALVAVLHKPLNDLQLLSGRKVLVKLDTRVRSKLDNAVLREVLNAAAVVTRPLVDHSLLTVVNGNECYLVEPACDISVGVNVTTSLGSTHSDTENRVVVKIHRTCKSSYVTVVSYLDRNILADLLSNVEIHILDLLVKVLFVYLDKERSRHNTVVNVNTCAGNADSVNTGHMRSRRLHSVKYSLIVIIGIGVSLGEPNDLLGIYALTVDNGADLTVASARVKSDAASVKMTSDRSCGRLIGRSVLKRSYLNLKGVLVNLLHKVYVKITASAMRESLFDLCANDLASRDDHLVTARYPKKRLCDTLNELEVLLVVTCSVAEYASLVCSGVSLVSFYSNNDILTVIARSLAHFAANERKGLEFGVEFSIYLKLHI